MGKDLGQKRSNGRERMEGEGMGGELGLGEKGGEEMREVREVRKEKERKHLDKN